MADVSLTARELRSYMGGVYVTEQNLYRQNTAEKVENWIRVPTYPYVRFVYLQPGVF